MSAADLYGQVSPRRPARKLMYAIDAGSFPDGKDAARFYCARCQHDSGWVYVTRTDVRRGVPCPTCNR